MRTIAMALVMLLSVSGAVRADEAKLREEIGTLRTEKAALEAKLKALTERLDKVETDMRRMRLDLARDMQEMSDRLAKLDGPGTPGTRVAVKPENPRTDDPFRNTTRNDTPKVTPSIAPPKTTTTTPDKGTKTTPSITTPTPGKTPEPPLPSIARADLPRIPDPVIPHTPIRTRPKVDRPKGTPTTVAMVDMLHLWNALKEKDAIEDGLGDLVYAVQFADQTWQKKIREYELDYSLQAEGSEAWLEKRRQIEAAYIERNVAIAAAKTKLNRRRGELTRLLYGKMVQAIGRVADQNGYDCAIFKESEPQYQKLTNVYELFNDRMVVRGNESVDLTEQVVRLMNQEFDKAVPSGN